MRLQPKEGKKERKKEREKKTSSHNHLPSRLAMQSSPRQEGHGEERNPGEADRDGERGPQPYFAFATTLFFLPLRALLARRLSSPLNKHHRDRKCWVWELERVEYIFGQKVSTAMIDLSKGIYGYCMCLLRTSQGRATDVRPKRLFR